MQVSKDFPLTSLCPYCLDFARTEFILIEKYWCNACRRSFTVLESAQARTIIAQNRVIKALEKKIA